MTCTAVIKRIHAHETRHLKFSDLAEIFNSLGHKNPKTNGIAGNVVFEAQSNDFPDIAQNLVLAISEKLGIDVSVLIKDHA